MICLNPQAKHALGNLSDFRPKLEVDWILNPLQDFPLVETVCSISRQISTQKSAFKRKKKKNKTFFSSVVCFTLQLSPL